MTRADKPANAHINLTYSLTKVTQILKKVLERPSC